MRWNLAYRTLFHDRSKLIAGLLGVIFSVDLVNVHGGPFSGLTQKANLLVDPKGSELREGNGRRVRVAGMSNGILSFLVTPYVFTSCDHVVGLAGANPDETSYLIARVKPGTDSAEVCRKIQDVIPDVAEMPTDEYAMVLERIGEYATLRAIGLSESEPMCIFAFQSAVVASIGVTIGEVLTVILKVFLCTPRAALEVTSMLYASSAALIFAICLFASGLPSLRVRRIDPHTALLA